MGDRMSFNNTFALVKRHWRLFLGIGLAAAVIAAVFSGPRFMKPRYASRAVVYPVHISTYSIETTADQLLQLMLGNSIRDSLIAKFHLVEHYGIDTAATAGRSTLYYVYGERVKIEKTIYESVEVTVTDEDPRTAQAMALEIVHQTNLLNSLLQRNNSKELLVTMQSDVARTKARMDSVEARLNELRTTKGLLDYTKQTEEVTKGYMKALTGNGSRANLEEIRNMLKALEENGGEFERLSLLNEQLVLEYADKRKKERLVEEDISKTLTYTNLVVHPEVSDKKVYPIRWLVVVLSVASALLLCYVLVFLREGRARPEPR
jgi:capsule polysaccharide export protein KpsE/RkpR